MDKKEEDKKRENALQALLSLDYKKAKVDDLKRIFELNISIETKDEYDETPLVKAIYAQNKEIVQYLVSNSADMYATNLSGETTMMICAKKGFLEIAEILLKQGYDLNKSVPSTKQSILGMAVWANQLDMVRWLLNNEININVVDGMNWTPLMIASYLGHTDIVKILKKKGANTDLKENHGWTALDLATLYHHEGIIELLM